MARIRTIKPEFFTSEDIVSLSPLARLLYIALWCEADKEGRFAWKPKTFKLRYMPGDKCDIDALCRELVGARLVVLYEDETLAYIPKFKNHQHINPRESASVLPSPPEIDASARVKDASPRDSDAQGGREGNINIDSRVASCDSTAEVVVSLPLVDGTEHQITDLMAGEWSELYPAVDVPQELREMRAWLMANPSRRKTGSGISRFVVNWLGKQQDRGGPRNAVNDDPYGLRHAL